MNELPVHSEVSCECRLALRVSTSFRTRSREVQVGDFQAVCAPIRYSGMSRLSHFREAASVQKQFHSRSGTYLGPRIWAQISFRVLICPLSAQPLHRFCPFQARQYLRWPILMLAIYLAILFFLVEVLRAGHGS
jgi:hypothetical protein